MVDTYIVIPAEFAGENFLGGVAEMTGVIGYGAAAITRMSHYGSPLPREMTSPMPASPDMRHRPFLQ